MYSCVLRTKTRSKIAPWQVQRSFDRRICAKAMKSPQTIRRLLARALKMHRCKSVGQNRHVSLPCMPHELREVRMLSLRQNKNSSFPGHAPGKDTLRAANAATEKGSTGENARANVVSRRALSPVKIKIPVATADMRRHSDTLRGAQRRRKRGLRGENRISGANSVVFPS